MRTWAACLLNQKSVRLLCNEVITRALYSWGYKKAIVPKEWHTEFPLCSEKDQSPIDIKTDDVVYDPKLKQFDLHELETARDVKMVLGTNLGRSVQVNLMGQNIRVTGGSLPGTYFVEQFHFHWGPNNSVGSEHTINGKVFASELHVVLHLDRYQNINDALNKPNGLAVLGFFIDVGNHNKNYDAITSRLGDVSKIDDSLSLPKFHLTSLFSSTNCYYRYYGRQTTPPCAHVIWTLFREPIYLSENQLKQFRQLGKLRSPDMDLIHNCRKTQPLDDRIVTSNCLKP